MHQSVLLPEYPTPGPFACFLHNLHGLLIFFHYLIVLQVQLLDIDVLLAHHLQSTTLSGPKFHGDSILQEVERLLRKRDQIQSHLFQAADRGSVDLIFCSKCPIW